MQPLTIAAFKEKQRADSIVLDSRNTSIFTEGFVPGSISIGLEGRFAEWAGSLLPFDRSLIFVTEPGQEEETMTRLAKVGFTKMEGYLQGGYAAWEKAGEKIDMIITVEADEVAMDLPHDPNLQIVDVRREAEFAEGHVKGAINMPLNDMTDLALMASFEENQNLYLNCGGGYRSVIAASLLKRQGIHHLRNIKGGWEALKEQKNIPVKKEPSLLN